MKRLAQIAALVVVTLFMACGNKKSAPDTEGTKEPEKTFKPAAEAGITDYGWIPMTDTQPIDVR